MTIQVYTSHLPATHVAVLHIILDNVCDEYFPGCGNDMSVLELNVYWDVDGLPHELGQ